MTKDRWILKSFFSVDKHLLSSAPTFSYTENFKNCLPIGKVFLKFFRPEKWLEIQGRVDCKLCKDPLGSRQMQEEELRQIYKRKAVDIFANGKMQRVW